MGPSHPYVAECLRVLAGYYHRAGDAITSEGLFRSCIARLEKPETPYWQNDVVKVTEESKFAMYVTSFTWTII